MKKHILHLSFILMASLCIQCNKIEDKKKELQGNLVNRALESATGTSSNVSDISKIEERKSEVELTLDGKPFYADLKNWNASIVSVENTLTISLSNELDNDDEYIQISIAAINTNGLLSQPIVAKANNEDETQLILSIMFTNNKGKYEMMGAAEGIATISKFTPEKTIFEIDAKIASPADLQKPSAWKTLKGTITCIYPIITTKSSETPNYY